MNAFSSRSRSRARCASAEPLAQPSTPRPASVPRRSHAPALDRTLELLRPEHRPRPAAAAGGYFDLLGARDPTGPHPGQRLMVSRGLPLIYERIWRPLGGRLLIGAAAQDEQRIALQMLEISPGDQVLDVGCGTGAFTRAFALRAGGGGLAVGLDASATMLSRAAGTARPANVAYFRADAAALPFADATFAAVSCFAALYLIEHPFRALDELVRVLAPGGRVALLASCARGPLPAALTAPLVKGLTGIRIFGRDELTGALGDRGLVDVRRRVSGLAQFVSARKPERSP